MKARTTSTQPRSTGGDQAGHVADFIDSIDPKRTSRSGVRAHHDLSKKSKAVGVQIGELLHAEACRVVNLLVDHHVIADLDTCGLTVA
jgi:hypothetical protein